MPNDELLRISFKREIQTGTRKNAVETPRNPPVIERDTKVLCAIPRKFTLKSATRPANGIIMYVRFGIVMFSNDLKRG